MNEQFECRPINEGDLADVSREALLWMFETALTIRLTEERIADLVEENKIVCPCHLYVGEEMVATGVCASLNPDDYVFSTHRSHGHYLAKGGSLNGLMAEVFGRATGCSHGKGGSMHIVDTRFGLPGSSAIVAGTIPLAVGAALGFKLQDSRRVSVAFFGDGATNEGAFYESMNLASVKRLPVVFVCENNLYSSHMPIAEIQADVNLYKKASVFNIPGERVDGNNLGEVYKAARAAVDRARRGEGPTFLECMTYRWRGHVGSNWDVDKGLRSQEEVDLWVGRCGIDRLREYLIAKDFLTTEGYRQIMDGVRDKIEAALDFALGSPYPEPEALYRSVFKEGTDAF